MAHPSVAVALVMMTMMVSCSNCVTSNKSIASITGTGNSTAAASSTSWCNGNIVDGQCMLVADATYGGGEHSDLNLDVTDLEVLEYYDLGESIARVLKGVIGKPGAYRVLYAQKPAIDARNPNKKYIGPNCGTYTRDRVCNHG